ncbi:hypothetical protein MPB2EB_0596 [Mycoavidus sp. B2-EB]|nr:hypothetical protein MPB2EB_0596 [Mycoavidus sp. B2-EB]
MFRPIINTIKAHFTASPNSQGPTPTDTTVERKKQRSMLKASSPISGAPNNTINQAAKNKAQSKNQLQYEDPFSKMIRVSNKYYTRKTHQENQENQENQIFNSHKSEISNLYKAALHDLYQNEVKPMDNNTHSKLMKNLSEKERDFYFQILSYLAPIKINQRLLNDPNHQEYILELKSRGIEIFRKPPPEGFYDDLLEYSDQSDTESSSKYSKEIHDTLAQQYQPSYHKPQN